MSTRNEVAARNKQISNRYKKMSDDLSFDEHVDVDYLVGQEWRPMPVQKTILGLSDNRIWSNDSKWATNNVDPYHAREMNRMKDSAIGASMRPDSFSSITEGYSNALMQRTDYVNADASAEWNSPMTRSTAYKFDREFQNRNPRRTNNPFYDSEGTFMESCFETPVRNQVSIARSNLGPAASCYNPNVGPTKGPSLPKVIGPGTRYTDPSAGLYGREQRINPCVKGKKVANPVGYSGRSGKAPISSGGLIQWNPWST